MNRKERERMVDRLLNEAFAPRDIEPRAGLEQRIIANLCAQPEPRRWWRWLRVPAAAAVGRNNRVPRPQVIATARRELPRQPVFAPGRLTQAESALVAMLQSKPAEAQTLFQEQEQTRLEASEFMEQATTTWR